MRFAFFVGCQLPVQTPELEPLSRAIFSRLGVSLVDMPFGCCGYPARRFSAEDHIALAARAFALAATQDIPILALCQCCYGSLSHARAILLRNEKLRSFLASRLAREGLRLNLPVVKHFLEVLGRDIGPAAIARMVVKPHTGLSVAAHYGCHGLRPSDTVSLDNPHAPTLLEKLLAAIGATPVDYPRRLECCGAPLTIQSLEMADRIRDTMLSSAAEAGASALVTVCPHCHHFFGNRGPVRSLPYLELLGTALGLPHVSIDSRDYDDTPTLD
jgi:heterodisulfide reductase subunit B